MIGSLLVLSLLNLQAFLIEFHEIPLTFHSASKKNFGKHSHGTYNFPAKHLSISCQTFRPPSDPITITKSFCSSSKVVISRTKKVRKSKIIEYRINDLLTKERKIGEWRERRWVGVEEKQIKLFTVIKVPFSQKEICLHEDWKKKEGAIDINDIENNCRKFCVTKTFE